MPWRGTTSSRCSSISIRSDQCNHRTDHCAAGAADHRRSDHDPLFLRRHHPCPGVEQHPAGVRRYRSDLTNATIGLITALQALRITGEVITTPYSFVATTHALAWNNIQPVFVDIDPATMNLNADLIEAAITPKTTAIMPVHCYGYPCQVDRIQGIADTYGLKVIYDAAHTFGVKHKGTSIAGHGDMAILSFHATKVFNTFEGGAIICRDLKTKQ